MCPVIDGQGVVGVDTRLRYMRFMLQQQWLLGSFNSTASRDLFGTGRSQQYSIFSFPQIEVLALVLYRV
ncbi:hypothetical protein FOBRF1_002435 [Fusarium oxysporum]